MKGTRIAKMAAHAIGMSNRSTFMKYGQAHFLSYRNYYSTGPDGEGDWEDWVRHGLAEARRSENGVTYFLTDAGFLWMEDVFCVTIHRDGVKEPDYPLDTDQKAEILDIWNWLKEHDVYTAEYSQELDVAVYSESDVLDDFMERFGGEESYVPARIYQDGIMVLFTDLLSFKATGKQIWKLRPEGMREEC